MNLPHQSRHKLEIEIANLFGVFVENAARTGDQAHLKLSAIEMSNRKQRVALSATHLQHGDDMNDLDSAQHTENHQTPSYGQYKQGADDALLPSVYHRKTSCHVSAPSPDFETHIQTIGPSRAAWPWERSLSSWLSSRARRRKWRSPGAMVSARL